MKAIKKILTLVEPKWMCIFNDKCNLRVYLPKLKGLMHATFIKVEMIDRETHTRQNKQA